MRRLLCLAMMSVVLLTACNTTPDTTPKQRAWPRLVVADSVFRQLPVGKVELQVNETTVDSVSQGKNDTWWVNIIYPSYCQGSVIYTTVTKVDEKTRESVIDNRVERMALNLGGNDAEVIEFENEQGWHCQLVSSLSPVVTPLQFIATNQGYVVTGAYYISHTGDSVAPYVNAVSSDIIHLLKTITVK